VKLQAYQDQVYQGRLRQIFPSADRAKSIVEVRVTIVEPDAKVKPEMTASVTFQEPRTARDRSGDGAGTEQGRSGDRPIVLVPRRAVTERDGQSLVWVVAGGVALRRVVAVGPVRLDQVEVRSGIAPGETVVLNPPAGLTDRGVVRVKGS
jgi:multidrug efflux pump subunit AcrA (membrane-fusion protein)